MRSYPQYTDSSAKLADDKFMRPRAHHQDGFTFAELIVVLGIGVILFGITSITLFRAQRSTKLTATTQTLISDLNRQQSKAMVGATEGREVSDSYGVYVSINSYMLFHGSSYVAGDPANFTVSLDAGTTITTTLPGSTVVFSKGSGGLSAFVSGANTITLTSVDGNDHQTITLNRYGVIVGVN